MKMLHRWELEWTTVITSDTAEVVVPMGNYQRTSPGATSARGWLEMRAEEGSIQVACSVTLANDVTAAGTATKVNSLVSTEGVSGPKHSSDCHLSVSRQQIRTAEFQHQVWRREHGRSTRARLDRGLAIALEC